MISSLFPASSSSSSLHLALCLYFLFSSFYSARGSHGELHNTSKGYILGKCAESRGRQMYTTSSSSSSSSTPTTSVTPPKSILRQAYGSNSIRLIRRYKRDGPTSSCGRNLHFFFYPLLQKPDLVVRGTATILLVRYRSKHHDRFPSVFGGEIPGLLPLCFLLLLLLLFWYPQSH